MDVAVELLEGVASELLVGFVQKTDEAGGGSQAGHSSLASPVMVGGEGASECVLVVVRKTSESWKLW